MYICIYSNIISSADKASNIITHYSLDRTFQSLMLLKFTVKLHCMYILNVYVYMYV